MARTAKSQAPTYDKAAAEAILAKYRDPKHFMQGGRGVSCYVWVNGAILSSENSIILEGNKVDAELSALPGVRYVKINID